VITGPDAPLPRAEQCPATSKRTQQRCRQMVIGGGPCPWHGGAAPQVAAKREQRIAVWQAQAAGRPVERRNAAAALVSAFRDSDEILQRLKLAMTDGGRSLDATTLDMLGAWIDRTQRLTKAVIDSGAEKNQAQLAEKEGQLIADAIRNILDAMHDRVHGLLDQDTARRMHTAWPAWVADVVPRELMRIAEQQAGADHG
jgi:hypothetical protein